MSFIHLRTNTEYSLVQGLSKIKDLVKKAVNDNQPALAMTDLNAMFGYVQFYSECIAKGVKPLLGVDMSVDYIDNGLKKTAQILVLSKNIVGHKSLLELHSKGYIENRTKDTVAIKEEWLNDLKEVVVLSGGIKGRIGQLILEDRFEDAKEYAKALKEKFGDDFYIEFQRDGSVNEEKYMEGAVKIAVELGIAPVATHPNYFLEKEDFLAHEARFCSAHGYELYDKDRPRLFNKEMYFKTTEEMEELFSDLPVALENTHVVAKKCSTKLVLNKPQLPKFPTENGMSEEDYFRKLSHDGLNHRLEDDYPDVAVRESKREEYVNRLNFEIDVVNKMGFPGYFLIVADFINWAKKNNIPVGPGRGSGAGSLVAYALGITNLDPIPSKLFFERFLNPERVSMPDFDIDFCQLRRQEVIEYVRKKYGANAVSQISAYGTLGAKSAVKDAARLLGFHNDFADNISKAMPSDPTDKTPLHVLVFGEEKDGKQTPPHADFLERYNNETDFKKVMDIAMKLEGLLRNIGTHAAGVVIAPESLYDFTPLFTLDNKGATSSQFDKDDVEKIGLVKFDFLGLKNLTAILEAVEFINKVNEANGQPKIDINKIDLNDQEMFKNIFHNGNTGSIFQFEGAGMTAVIREAKPTHMEDLIAINALYRPGPMSIIPDWQEARKLPEHERKYPHPLLKEALKETCGFMIYQEQVMQCAQILAGYSLGGADILRRAMGKKKPEEMVAQRATFVSGCAKNNVSEEQANELFDLIEKFSGYGFNKSHAAAYTLLALQTAYLKHYYPQEFFMATLNSELREDSTDKIALAILDARKNGIETLPVDINQSDWLMSITNTGAIRYGLGALKGIGEAPSKAIENERKARGPFKNFYDFIERAASENFLNKRVLEALICAGAFDSLHDNRAELFENVAVAIHYGSEYAKALNAEKSAMGPDALPAKPVEASEGQPKPVRRTRKTTDLKILARPTFKEAKPWDNLELALQEKKAYSYYFSNNPFESIYTKQLNGLKVMTPLNELLDAYEAGQKYAFIAGTFSDFKMWKSKSGGFLTISDGISSQSIMTFISQYEESKDWLKKDAFVGLHVELQKGNDGSLKLKILKMCNFDQTRELLAYKSFISTTRENVGEIKEKLKDFIIDLNNKEDIKTALPLVLCEKVNEEEKAIKIEKIPVKKSAEFINFCREEFGDDMFKMSYIEDEAMLPRPEPKYNNQRGGQRRYNN